MLDADGAAVDDLYVYRRGAEDFVLVVNAANFDADLAWLSSVNAGEATIDPDDPARRIPPVQLRPLRDAGEDSLVVFALQGPLSLETLCTAVATEPEREWLRGSRLNQLSNISVDGVPVMVARTGYTGERHGFELFVHPESATVRQT